MFASNNQAFDVGVTALNSTTGNALWFKTYTGIVNATSGGEVIVSTVLGIPGSAPLQLDTNGNVLQSLPDLSSSVPFDAGRWVGYDSNGRLDMVTGPYDDVASTVWPYPGGTREGQNGACSNDRDALIQEYSVSYRRRDGSVAHPTAPNCSEFTATTRTAHFSFEQLNVSEINAMHYKTWAILKHTLLIGLEALHDAYWLPEFTIASGYRSPWINHNIEERHSPLGFAPDSAHVYGNAVDIDIPYSNSQTLSWNNLKAAALGPNVIACVEPHKYTGSGELHADWRPQTQCGYDWTH
jgi:hypothetical protein